MSCAFKKDWMPVAFLGSRRVRASGALLRSAPRQRGRPPRGLDPRRAAALAVASRPRARGGRRAMRSAPVAPRLASLAPLALLALLPRPLAAPRGSCAELGCEGSDATCSCASWCLSSADCCVDFEEVCQWCLCASGRQAPRTLTRVRTSYR